ncbi:MAG: hypothetical protein ABIX44_09695 [Cryobacterium sp.]
MSTTLPTGIRFRSSLMRATVLVASLAMAVVALTFAPSASASAATQTIAQCDSVYNTAGLGLNCDVTVVNNLDLATGVESSTVTTKACHGAANTAPEACVENTQQFKSLTRDVSQCNYALDGGGASLICNVSVVNNITGAASTEPATVNQCVGSGAAGTEPTLNCDPNPASTSSATITQCNGSANGGGASKRVTCTVLPSTQSSQLPVSINQCNNSANGGGSVVTCSASLTNNISAASTKVTPLKNVLHDSKTDGLGMTGTSDNGTAFLGGGILMLLAGGLLTAAFATRKAGARR